MSWEQRGKKRYYYRNMWRNGRSERAYFGSGDAAEFAAAADRLHRLEQEIAARQQGQEQEFRTVAESLLLELCEQTDLLVRAALVAAGYHQHDRGAWRRKRERDSPKPEE